MDAKNTPFPLNVSFNSQDNMVMDSGNPGMSNAASHDDPSAHRLSGGGGAYSNNFSSPFSSNNGWNQPVYPPMPMFNMNTQPPMFTHNTFTSPPSLVVDEDSLRQRALQSVPNSTTTKPGAWVFNTMIENIEFVTKDGIPIGDYSDCIAIARARKDPSYMTAHQALIEYIQQPIKLEYQAQLHRAHSDIRSLEEKLQKMSLDFRRENRSRSRSPVRNRRDYRRSRSPGRSRQNERRTRREPSPITPSNVPNTFNSLELQSSIGHGTLDTLPFQQSAECMYTCILLIHRRLGHPENSIDIEWDIEHTGKLCTPAAIADIAQEGHILPNPRPSPKSAIPIERRLTPASSEELNQWIVQSKEPGNWAALDRVRDMIKILNVINHLERTSHYNSFSDAEKSAFNIFLASPDWAEYDAFPRPRDVRRTTDGPVHWGKNPSTIPRVTTSTTLEGTGNHMYLHVQPSLRLGVRMTDSGYIDLNSVQAHLIYTKLKPKPTVLDGRRVNEEDRRVLTRFRRTFLHLVSQPYWYSQIVEQCSLTIKTPPNNHQYSRFTAAAVPGFLTERYPVVPLAKFLASAGVTIQVIDSMFRWAQQVCIDAQSFLPIEDAQFLRECYRDSVIRMMFAGTPSSIFITQSHRVPLDWDLSHIKEHRRRVAVSGLLLQERKVIKGYEPPRVFPTLDAGIDLSGLSVQSNNADSSTNASMDTDATVPTN
ncbi:hypothetical protein VKT23_007926 [Stygiomarasmius scandens]|uniref:Uncharacterized protein n=1 Tax=Marasmiellus scandens TaxID=2682957 RepID=A0ABR1JKZ8_9AGAR